MSDEQQQDWAHAQRTLNETFGALAERHLGGEIGQHDVGSYWCLEDLDEMTLDGRFSFDELRVMVAAWEEMRKADAQV